MQHPFLDNTCPIRWDALKPEAMVPDITRALEEAEARLRTFGQREQLSDVPESFLAITEELSPAWAKLDHIAHVCDSEEVRKAHNTLLPAITAFFTRLFLNADAYAVLQRYAASKLIGKRAPVWQRWLQETLADFEEHGAGLDEAGKARLEIIEQKLAALTKQFAENMLDATSAWERILTDASELDGLPASTLEQLRQDALAHGKGTVASPQWRLTLHAPCVQPILRYVHNEGIRREVWQAHMAIGTQAPHNNIPIIREILALRQELANLLGKKTFGDFILQRRMAHDGLCALRFVEDMHARVAPYFKKEWEGLDQFRAKETQAPTGPLMPWERSYWIERYQQATLDFDEEALRPYFALKQVMDGLFRLAERVLGIHCEPVEAPVWHPDVRCYRVRDAHRHLGYFYTDWFPRDSKRSGAWMDALYTDTLFRETHGHIGVICGNLTPPTSGQDAYLTHDEVETIFHEFGHLLHHLMSHVPVASLAGTQVAWDFVELPSQIMENWCWEPEALPLFAKHHETGQPIPSGLMDKKLATRRFMVANFMMRQLQFGKMDLELHQNYKKHRAHLEEGAWDVYLDEVLKGFRVPSPILEPTIITQFGHLFSDPFGPYAAGYYSYMWAAVLDADAFTRFKKEGILNPQTGAAWVSCVLSQGNAVSPDALFVQFMGRPPRIEALLERNGLYSKS